MSMHNELVNIENASITFASGTSLFRSRQSKTKALDNISISITSGKSLGVVGGNGSGKSTLLKLLAGIYLPDSGSIRHYTHAVSLLALGAGYEATVTARDNVILNAMLLGMRYDEAKSKCEPIFEFAELSNKMDTPIKNYSTGMRSRLSFSTVLFANCDLLLIDELLAVGDIHFRKKSGNALRAMIANGTTVVLVSHQFDSLIEICRESIWLKDGEIIHRGETAEVIAEFSKN